VWAILHSSETSYSAILRESALRGFEKRGIPFYKSEGNFVSSTLETRRSRSATDSRSAASLCATVAMKSMVVCEYRGNAGAGGALFAALDECGSDRYLLVFDMDGVLAEVTESFAKRFVQTVHHFTARRSSATAFRNTRTLRLQQRLAPLATDLRDLGVEVPYAIVAKYFCDLFFGPNGTMGGCARSLGARDGLLESLAQRYRLSIFTADCTARPTSH